RAALRGGSCRTPTASRHDLDLHRLRHGRGLCRLAPRARLALRRLRPLLGHRALARGLRAAGWHARPRRRSAVAAVVVLVARRRAAAPRRANGLARGLTAAGATVGLALV